MPRNIEIKARVPDLNSVRAKVTTLTSAPPQLISQTDTFFTVPRGRLKVREFEDGSGELIAYQRPDGPGPKRSVYTIVQCADADKLAQVLATAIPVRGRVVKRRELFMVGRTRVHLDEVEELGSFVELEVVLRDDESVLSGEVEAHQLLEALGIPPAALASDAYIDLLMR